MQKSSEAIFFNNMELVQKSNETILQPLDQDTCRSLVNEFVESQGYCRSLVKADFCPFFFACFRPRLKSIFKVSVTIPCAVTDITFYI